MPRVRFPAMEFFIFSILDLLLYKDMEDYEDNDDSLFFLFVWIPTIAQLVERRTVVVNRFP